MRVDALPPDGISRQPVHGSASVHASLPFALIDSYARVSMIIRCRNRRRYPLIMSNSCQRLKIKAMT